MVLTPVIPALRKQRQPELHRETLSQKIYIYKELSVLISVHLPPFLSDGQDKGECPHFMCG
jgi:hypothetical protein